MNELATTLLTQLGLDASHHHQAVNTLSIGQQQRVGRSKWAVIGEPEVIIADEPTSALDEDNRKAFIELLFEQTDKTGATVVFVSHEKSLAPLFSKVSDLSEVNQLAGVASLILLKLASKAYLTVRPAYYSVS